MRDGTLLPASAAQLPDEPEWRISLDDLATFLGWPPARAHALFTTDLD